MTTKIGNKGSEVMVSAEEFAQEELVPKDSGRVHRIWQSIKNLFSRSANQGTPYERMEEVGGDTFTSIRPAENSLERLEDRCWKYLCATSPRNVKIRFACCFIFVGITFPLLGHAFDVYKRS